MSDLNVNGIDENDIVTIKDKLSHVIIRMTYDDFNKICIQQGWSWSSTEGMYFCDKSQIASFSRGIATFYSR